MLQNAPSTTDEARLAHIRAHRSGRPAKIASDPELRAFVEERLSRMIFADIAAEVAVHFPPDRRVSMSSIHRWWQQMQRGQS